MIIHNVEQRSEDWFRIRCGVLTASNFKTARERVKNGDFAATAKKLAAKIAIERIAGEPQSDTFVNFAMRRGVELEPVATSNYEVHTGQIVTAVGFVTTDCKTYGASPDGFVKDHKGIEVKCPLECERVIDLVVNHNHADYMDQVQGNMWITEREEWDLVIYTPQLESVGKALNVYPYKRDESYIEKMLKDLSDFNNLVLEYVTALSTKEAA